MAALLRPPENFTTWASVRCCAVRYLSSTNDETANSGWLSSIADVDTAAASVVAVTSARLGTDIGAVTATGRTVEWVPRHQFP